MNAKNYKEAFDLLRVVAGRLLKNGSIEPRERDALSNALRYANMMAGVEPENCTATQIDREHQRCPNQIQKGEWAQSRRCARVVGHAGACRAHEDAEVTS